MSLAVYPDERGGRSPDSSRRGPHTRGVRKDFLLTRHSTVPAGTLFIQQTVLSLFTFVALQDVLAQTAPSITMQPQSQVVPVGSNVTFTVAVSGAGPFTFQWQFNRTNLPDNIITTVAGNGAGAYSGDAGQATNASLYFPHNVNLETYGSGNLASLLMQPTMLFARWTPMASLRLWQATERMPTSEMAKQRPMPV